MLRWACRVALLALVANARVSVEYESDPSQFKIAVDGVEWFSNDAVMLTSGNETYWSRETAVAKNKKLSQTSCDWISGSDGWGPYSGVKVAWEAPDGAKMITTLKNYSADIITFTQTFPDGLEGCSVDNTDPKNSVSSGFPAFMPKSLAGTPSEQRRWIAYNGWDCSGSYGCVTAQKSRVALGVWSNETSVLPQGLEGSGPIAVMTADASASVVLSAAKEFMSASQQFMSVAEPSPAPTPGPAALALFNKTAGQYCADGNQWAFTANNISLEECAEQCVKLSCDAFDYDPTPKRPQPYCDNCRVLHPGIGYKLTHTDNKYSAYTRPPLPLPNTPGILSYGLTGSITSVPEGYSIEYVLSAGDGVNRAVRRWGDLLTSRYNKTNPEDQDFTTTHLGYDTDNGAYYYYNPEAGKSYEETLWDVHQYAAQVGIPYRHVQLDSWWYIKGAGGGTKSWTPGPNTFPSGLASFHNKTKWRITAHNRMWSSDTVYAKQNGGQYEWLVEGKEAVPLEQRFWDYLMEQGKAWGLYVYEQDWLFTEYVGTSATLSSATLPRQWLMQMGQGAEKAGLLIQSLELPAVTTARASTDYDAGKNDQWVMGLSSLFLDALALRPTKDNYFSTDAQVVRGTGKKGVERFNRLQALVSTLSTGPVFPSDAINNSDVALILRSCTADGLVLKPDRAATNMDANIVDKAWASHVKDTDPGELQTTRSTILSGDGKTNYTTYYVLAANTKAGSYSLSPAEVAGETDSHAAARRFLAFESNSSSTLFSFDTTHPLHIPTTDRWNFTYHTISPTLPNGYTFFGEADRKWVSAAAQRFSNFTWSSDKLTVTAHGQPGEKIRLFFAGPNSDASSEDGRAASSSFECTIGHEGYALALMPEATCSA